MLIRGSPDGLRHPHPQLVAIPGMGGRDPSEQVVTIIGMLEGSNRSRVTGTAANSARDLFEAGLNEAASVEHGLWALDQHDDGAIISPGPYSGSIVSEMQASIDRTVAWSITSRCWWQKSIDGSAVAKPWEMRVIVPPRSVGRQNGIGSGGQRVRPVMRYHSVMAGAAVTAIAARDRSQPWSRRTGDTDRYDVR